MGVGWLAVHYINKILNCHILSTYLDFLFVHNHWDLVKCLANWDEIWHKHMGKVGVGLNIIKIRITRCFAYQSTFSICA